MLCNWKATIRRSDLSYSMHQPSIKIGHCGRRNQGCKWKSWQKPTQLWQLPPLSPEQLRPPLYDLFSWLPEFCVTFFVFLVLSTSISSVPQPLAPNTYQKKIKSHDSLLWSTRPFGLGRRQFADSSSCTATSLVTEQRPTRDRQSSL